MNNITKKLKIINNKSYSPSINRRLVSFKTLKASPIKKCNNIYKLNINNKCHSYKSKIVKNKLLNNLKSSKHLKCNLFITPKQYLSNCWFNVLFIVFFFSDKGKKFFKFLRQLMIEGKNVHGITIPNKLHKIFYIFNMAIELYYNQNNISSTNIKFVKKFNTNILIKNIYNILKKKNIETFNINEPGNPLDYYKHIITYLNYNPISIISVSISEYYINSIDYYVEKHIKDINLNSNYKYPDIIVIEIIDDISKFINNKQLNINLYDKNNINHTYTLDSVVIRDTTKQHFSSLITCNNKQYKYDGASYKKMNKFNWKKYINDDKPWGFEGHHLKFNFRNSYQMLFYYKI